MSSLISKYTWLVDTIRRSRRISREEFNRRWRASTVGNGADMPRRTFYNYRQAVFDIFGVEILYDSASGEYYIEESESHAPQGSGSVTDFLLNNAALSGMIGDARSISDRLFLEQIPSARHNLEPMIEAVKSNRLIKFNYHPFNRSRATRGVVIEPYLLKLFRQRWYVAGRNVAEGKVKTYALDRISEPELQAETFVMSTDFNPGEYFRYSFGIVVDSSEPRIVKLRADAHQAKYLRALPLHPSQQEEIHDDYSIFTYRLLLTPDFLRELMSLGPDVKVEEPQELRLMLKNRLRETLALYP
ncbi:MAG: WYL domain-containing protein [Bacteroides sp.]|nr:WYL domain-containing protein [Bacteroides sp.]MCM1380084.1 WYL domain-containing protein [Bacteroides sp.]MCM1446421.1 WYL domain-containing protein [Prevotella sp.]